MGAEQGVLTNTISRSYFNFKNCYTGRFILSHFTFQHNLHNTNQTVNVRVLVFPLSPWTFKQDKQENKLNICGGTHHPHKWERYFCWKGLAECMKDGANALSQGQKAHRRTVRQGKKTPHLV